VNIVVRGTHSTLDKCSQTKPINVYALTWNWATISERLRYILYHVKDVPWSGHVNVVVFPSLTITEIRLKSDSQTLHRKHSYTCYNPDVAVQVMGLN
jgi:hypothetical protein